MRKYLPYLFTAALAFLAPLAVVAQAHAHHTSVHDEPGAGFDCLVDGDHYCGMHDRPMVEQRAAEMSNDRQRCQAVTGINIAGFENIGIECTPIDPPIDPTVHADGTPAPPLSQEQDTKLRADAPKPIKVKPNFTG